MKLTRTVAIYALLHLQLFAGILVAQGPALMEHRLAAKVAYRTLLSEVGQSGVCVSGDRLFLTVHKKMKGPLDHGFYFNSDIVGQCFDRNSGKLLWQVELPGTYDGRVLESWHDSTSLLPVANDRHVVFHNLNGMLGCYTIDGELVWEHSWEAPDPDIKNSRMLLHENTLVVALPINRIAVNATAKHPALPFYSLHCFDLATGEQRWVSPVLLHHATQYSIDRWEGENVIVASMIDLSHWKFQQGRKGYLLSFSDGGVIEEFKLPPAIPHQKNQLCDGKFLVTSATGASKTKFQLIEPVDGTVEREFEVDQPDQYYAWKESGYVLAEFESLFADDRTLGGKGMPTPSTVHAIGKRIYFWRYDSSAIGCLDVTSGRCVMVQAPLQIRSDTIAWFVEDFQFTDGIRNSSNQLVSARVGTVRGIRRGGFGHTNPAWPRLHDGKLYWMNGAGVLYVINTKQPFGPQSLQWLAINPSVSSWTYGAPAVDSDGVYLRSQRELARFDF